MFFSSAAFGGTLPRGRETPTKARRRSINYSSIMAVVDSVSNWLLTTNPLTTKLTNQNWPIKTATAGINAITRRRLFTWLWKWLPLRQSKCQSPTTVFLKTTLTQTITLDKQLITNNSLSEDYSHPDDHTRQTTDTPGFKPFNNSLSEDYTPRRSHKTYNWYSWVQTIYQQSFGRLLSPRRSH